MSEAVKELSSIIKSLYTYRKIILSSEVNITFLNSLDENDFSRDIRCKYIINISKDNSFTTPQIITICSNIDYINELIKNKIMSGFPKIISDEANETYEYDFDLELKSLIITMEYRILDRIINDHNNHAITQFIIGTLLDAASELGN